MTEPDYATNVVKDAAQVGAVAETIHGGVHTYFIEPGATSEKKYQVGVSYLTARAPSLALPLIGEAIAEGYDTSEVRFHWLLALLSGRTFRQLSSEDIDQLDELEKQPVIHQFDPWSAGIKAVLSVLKALRSPGTDPGPSIDAIEGLSPDQKKLILQHITVFLKGPSGDRIWLQTVEAAGQGRYANERCKGVKYFFYSDPVEVYRRQVVPAMVTSGDYFAAFTASAFFLLALMGIAVELVVHVRVAGLAGVLIGCGGLCLAAVPWTEYRWQIKRWAGSRRRLLASDLTAIAQERDRFATKIDQRFDRYLKKYPPKDEDMPTWLSATWSIRNQLTDELAEIYRDRRPRVTMERLNWLIVYEVWELAKRWDRNQGRLYEPPGDDSHLKPMVLWTGIAVMVLGGMLAAFFVVSASPFVGSIALVVLAATGGYGAHQWTNITVELRRVAADEAESDRKFAERQEEYEKWCRKLDDLRPLDPQMAEWLECDKKVILKRALDHYGLKRSDVISHAFLETPGTPYKRASDLNGPWRYSRYKIIVFLLTADGIRQLSYELQTGDGDIQQLEWRSYRYDAIASVEAIVARKGSRQEFNLHLMDGKTISFRVADALTGPDAKDGTVADLSTATDAEALSTATEDTTGMRNTRSILEGVAADGKQWIARETLLPPIPL